MTVKESLKLFASKDVKNALLGKWVNLTETRKGVRVSNKKLEGCLPSKIFLKEKTVDGVFVKLKARLVIQGNFQPEGSFGETKAPTMDKSTLFAYCDHNKVLKGKMYSVDIPCAFLFAPLEEKVNMKIGKSSTELLVKINPDLKKFVQSDGCLYTEILMSLYGLKQAPRNWYMFMVDVMSKCDMKKSTYDGCIFYRARKSLRTIAGIHVDDLLMISNDEEQVGLIKRV